VSGLSAVLVETNNHRFEGDDRVDMLEPEADEGRETGPQRSLISQCNIWEETETY